MLYTTILVLSLSYPVFVTFAEVTCTPWQALTGYTHSSLIVVVAAAAMVAGSFEFL
jgi:hypothetical protein